MRTDSSGNLVGMESGADQKYDKPGKFRLMGMGVGSVLGAWLPCLGGGGGGMGGGAPSNSGRTVQLAWRMVKYVTVALSLTIVLLLIYATFTVQ